MVPTQGLGCMLGNGTGEAWHTKNYYLGAGLSYVKLTTKTDVPMSCQAWLLGPCRFDNCWHFQYCTLHCTANCTLCNCGVHTTQIDLIQQHIFFQCCGYTRMSSKGNLHMKPHGRNVRHKQRHAQHRHNMHKMTMKDYIMVCALGYRRMDSMCRFLAGVFDLEESNVQPAWAHLHTPNSSKKKAFWPFIAYFETRVRHLQHPCPPAIIHFLTQFL